LAQLALDTLVQYAKQQDPLAREELIARHQTLIVKTVAAICRRHVDWHNDDEISIGLMAFNEAIDTYDPSRGVEFIPYARMVIRHRLLDHFRREARNNQHLSLDHNSEEMYSVEAKQAWDNYLEVEEARDRAEMVAEFAGALAAYGITLDDLVQVSPKHRDTKASLITVARAMVAEPNLLVFLDRYRQLPLKELEEMTGMSRKVLERGRKYIIALVLILSRKEFSPMREFLHWAVVGEAGK